MAIPSAFRERLEQMEQSRNERLSILQSEKELQQSKSQVLASRLSNIASMEQRCLKLDRKIASQYLFISSLKSRLHRLDADYLQNLQKHRDLKDEVDNLEELEKEEQSYYSLGSREMEEFREQVGNFLVECQVQVEELRNHVNELKARFAQLLGNLNHSNNSEIAAAEMRKTQLLATKENLEKNLALNYQLREQLTNLLLSTLMGQNPEKK
ncbi:uncharacterized protein LOC107799790 [Nicotiana tabacum]|uniref:Probable kinetochore protein NDC80 n=1 Tax=Nicotiana tabacum TaxID=4097 RepID=A0A1S4APG7_TOBAC|nr:probable kinetochore protein NDC80 [Nicotiana tomentosiformis]XP_016478425.1 PREDICTED: probable kinetochore protein NDC80 [Nicotiana tabacum]XP_033510235.1 probable kinetochore protein NDC80 [Nicotiana tomentosiformis]